MTTPNDPLQKLADDAEAEVRASHAHTEAMAGQAAQPSSSLTFKRGLAIGLAVACVAVLATQWRQFSEPFPSPEVGSDISVAEADLEAVASFIEAFRVSQGRYPESLSEVRLPGGLADLAQQHGMRYKRTEQAYTIEWSLPLLQAVYDGAAQKARVEKVKSP